MEQMSASTVIVAINAGLLKVKNKHSMIYA